MLDIDIRTIPHNTQRYSTTGDYWDEGEREIIRVSAMKEWRYEFLVGIHELIEKALLKHRGVPISAIDEFDMSHEDSPDPGDEPDAPYKREHCFATGVERILAAELGVNWSDYEDEIDGLYAERPTEQ